MAHPKKTIVIVGITGNQGLSVFNRFRHDPSYHIKGITRNPTTPLAEKLTSQGAELITADLNDLPSLTRAFAGANAIFTVTNYWEPFFRPDCRAEAAARGISAGRFAYETEVRHGRNMADAAAATVETLDENGLIASTEGHGTRATNGEYGADGMLHYDAKCEVFPEYVQQKYPDLARKMSCVWTATFTLSWMYMPHCYYGKVDEETYVRRLTTRADREIPHIDIVRDLGAFVYAVKQMPPGKTYLAYGQVASWPEVMKIWGMATGKKASYTEISVAEMEGLFDDPATGTEFAHLFHMFSGPGIWCGKTDLITAEDIRKAGIECPMTSLEESFRNTDFSMAYGQPVNVTSPATKG